MKLHFVNVNPNKLHDELIAQGINPYPVETNATENTPGNEIWLTLPDNISQEVIDKINAIVDAHDPTPLPHLPTKIDYLLDLDYRLSKIELGL